MTDTSDSDGSSDGGTTSIHSWGDGRRSALDAIEEKPRLDSIESPANLQELTDAVREIALRREKYDVMGVPEDVIETIISIHDGLPEEAQSHYVSDDVLVTRINRTRSQFNDWIGRLKREKQILSPVEAGPANYPAKKARKTSRLEREAKQELNECIDGIESAARGGRQRALEAIGTSVAKQNEKERKSDREQMREELEEGHLIHFRNPNFEIGEVVRVNTKTVTARYPNPRAGGTKPLSDEPEPDYIETRVKLESNWLIRLTDERLETVDEVEFDSVAEIRADKFDSEGD